MCGATPVILESTAADEYLLKPEKLRECLVKHPNVKGIILCNPSNPTGSVAVKDNLLALAAVLKDFPKVDLMLAGHTHGFQFGIEIPYFRWSPVQYVYKEWAGLYQEGHQYLYVNRGLGFLGYPGRVGIIPEITLFEFECA